MALKKRRGKTEMDPKDREKVAHELIELMHEVVTKDNESNEKRQPAL